MDRHISENFADRNPQDIYCFFEDISKIPRGSGNERAIAEYLVGYAKKHGFSWIHDEYQNVLIRCPGTAGCEDQDPVLLECHTDMVCVKKPGIDHDFTKDPIKLVRDKDGIVHADGTSLGADNGCGVAICLAIMERDDSTHPPLECFFAAQEETGLIGAAKFDAANIRSKRAIGLDAGSDGVFCKGTTTKHSLTIKKDFKTEKSTGQAWTFELSGLCGGYPALCMPMERISAIESCGEILCEIERKIGINIVDICAESRGIPENFKCTFTTDSDETILRKIFKDIERRLQVEYKESEPSLKLNLYKSDSEIQIMKVDSKEIAYLISLLPYEIFGRNLERLDLVNGFGLCKSILSDNLKGSVIIKAAFSTDTDEKFVRVFEKIKTYLELCNAYCESDEVETGWKPSEHSPIREIMVKAYNELFGKDPIIKISHGGNDCVELYKKIPDMDIVTTAADYINFHTPDEYLVLDSFEREYDLIVHTLELLSRNSI